MSHEDSLDEETKRILAEVDADDSKESEIPEKPKNAVKEIETKEEFHEEDIVLTNDAETPDSEW